MQELRETGSLVQETERKSFSPPAEPEWHRMISEAAYYLAAKRSFAAGNELADWLAAEADVRGLLATGTRAG